TALESAADQTLKKSVEEGFLILPRLPYHRPRLADTHGRFVVERSDNRAVVSSPGPLVRLQGCDYIGGGNIGVAAAFRRSLHSTLEPKTAYQYDSEESEHAPGHSSPPVITSPEHFALHRSQCSMISPNSA